MRYRLSPNGNLSKHLQRLIQSINEDIVLALVRACRDPEIGVHEARKSCKEMRALLRLFRPQIGRAEFRQRQTQYKTLAGRLSGSRDAMVRLKTWRGLIEENADLQVEPYGVIESFLLEQKNLDPLEDKGRDFLIDMALEVEVESAAPKSWDLPKSLADLMPNLKRIYQKARDAEKKARDSDDIEHFHQFRKRSKDLFYCARVLWPMFGKSLKARVDDLEAMTEIQGQANDQAVLWEFLNEHRVELDLDEEHWDVAEGCILSKLSDLQKKSHKQAGKLMHDAPSAFIKSL